MIRVRSLVLNSGVTGRILAFGAELPVALLNSSAFEWLSTMILLQRLT